MCMWEPRVGKILVWVGADVTPTTGHQRFSAGNTPGGALARMVWGWGASGPQTRGFQGDFEWGLDGERIGIQIQKDSDRNI